MKQFMVIAYDIADNRRRQKISKVLVQYGLRCNESVFECLLSEARIRQLKQKLQKLANEQEDILLYYYLCKPCVMQREGLGRRPMLPPDLVMV